MNESWRDVKGFEGLYQISSLGRVKSLPKATRFRTFDESIMVLHVHVNDYHVVWLRRPGVHQKFFVHRLVADAFLSNPLFHPVVNHLDRNRTNNAVSNLEWCTHAENSRHWRALVLVEEKPIDLADIPF